MYVHKGNLVMFSAYLENSNKTYCCLLAWISTHQALSANQTNLWWSRGNSHLYDMEVIYKLIQGVYDAKTWKGRSTAMCIKVICG